MSGPVTTEATFHLLAIGPDGLAELAQAMDRAGLPSDDVRELGRRFFRFAEADGVIGFGGLEGEAPDLLLRSVVVQPGARSRGHGTGIVRALEEQATALGGARLHLLTTTAADSSSGSATGRLRGRGRPPPSPLPSSSPPFARRAPTTS